MPFRPPPDSGRDTLRARLVTDVVAFATGAPVTRILDAPRGAGDVSGARQLVMYLLSSAFSLSLARIAYLVGRERSTVAYGVRAVEERREDPAYDAFVEALEETLRSAPEADGLIVVVAPRECVS